MLSRGRRTTRADSSDERELNEDIFGLKLLFGESEVEEKTNLEEEDCDVFCKCCRRNFIGNNKYMSHFNSDPVCMLTYKAGHHQYKKRPGQSLRQYRKALTKAASKTNN